MSVVSSTFHVQRDLLTIYEATEFSHSVDQTIRDIFCQLTLKETCGA